MDNILTKKYNTYEEYKDEYLRIANMIERYAFQEQHFDLHVLLCDALEVLVDNNPEFEDKRLSDLKEQIEDENLFNRLFKI